MHVCDVKGKLVRTFLFLLASLDSFGIKGRDRKLVDRETSIEMLQLRSRSCPSRGCGYYR